MVTITKTRTIGYTDTFGDNTVATIELTLDHGTVTKLVSIEFSGDRTSNVKVVCHKSKLYWETEGEYAAVHASLQQLEGADLDTKRLDALM